MRIQIQADIWSVSSGHLQGGKYHRKRQSSMKESTDRSHEVWPAPHQMQNFKQGAWINDFPTSQRKMASLNIDVEGALDDVPPKIANNNPATTAAAMMPPIAPGETPPLDASCDWGLGPPGELILGACPPGAGDAFWSPPVGMPNYKQPVQNKSVLSLGSMTERTTRHLWHVKRK